MSDRQEVTFGDRPWMTGPMCVQRHGDHIGAVWTGTDPEAEGSPLCSVHRQRSGLGSTDWLAGSAYMRMADAELMALAPEMAEAILCWDLENHPASDEYECDRVLRSAAAKLRVIGGDHV